MNDGPPMTRTQILDAALGAARTVERVEATLIELTEGAGVSASCMTHASLVADIAVSRRSTPLGASSTSVGSTSGWMKLRRLRRRTIASEGSTGASKDSRLALG